MKSLIASVVPHYVRQAMKRRLFGVRDMRDRLTNLRRAGFRPSGAIDGGAYRGEWTREFWSVWPNTPTALIEPLPALHDELRGLAAKTHGSFVVSAALSDRNGVAPFSLAETNSQLSKVVVPGETAEVQCVTLSALMAGRPDFTPTLLKLDLQGSEIPALVGAGDLLRSFEVVLLEVSVIPIGDVPTFSEVHQFMIDRDYRIYDVIPQYYRPLDGALWQMDVFFVRNDSPLVSSNAWQ